MWNNVPEREKARESLFAGPASNITRDEYRRWPQGPSGRAWAVKRSTFFVRARVAVCRASKLDFSTVSDLSFKYQLLVKSQVISNIF